MEFTKEQLIEKLRHRIAFATAFPDSEKAQIDLAVFRIALASLEAEPVGYFGRFEADDEELIDQCSPSINGAFPLYAPQPAPVVPEEMPKGLAGQIVSLLAHNIGDKFLAQKIWNACRTAMHLCAEPVKTAYKLPELTDSQCLEFLAVAFRHARIKGDIEFDDIRLGLKMALEAAPQQEVKP
ncbi:hypothetical protein RN615_002485 [Escherichia coli]|nr:hypothetical protein [Escherichia coli]